MPKDSPAVALWRDFAHLNLSASWKIDVDKTITDIELWRKILAGWHYFDAKGKKRNKHPGIKNLLTEYERQSSPDAVRKESGTIHCAESIPERIERILPEQRMPPLLARESGWK